jgi:pimeloyl-ACP methyl ester carboxylesterase
MPTIVFLSGYRSDMTGIKATQLQGWAAARGLGCVCFDYSGTGASTGRFAEATLGDWIADALAVVDGLTAGPLILVGSSMGAWIMLQAAVARPERVRALVGVAAAPDFSERLVLGRLDAPARAAFERSGVLVEPSLYDAAGTPFHWRLVEEARRHLVLEGPISFVGPVRLLHGLADPDVPWTLSLELAETLAGGDVRLVLVKDGDHRLSRPQDITLLTRTLDELVSEIEVDQDRDVV